MSLSLSLFFNAFVLVWKYLDFDPKYSQFWSQVVSRTFLRNKWARRSILCIIFLGSETLIFWPWSNPNIPNLGSGDLDWSRKPLCRNHRTKSSVLVYNLSRCENLWNLTRNPPNFGRVTSDDLKNHFLVITGPRAVFWYIICPGLKIFVFWPQMTQTFCDLIPFHYQNGVKIFLDYNKNKSIEFLASLAYFYR